MLLQLVYITIEATEGMGSWSSITSMDGLAEHLLAPSPMRAQGTHDAQGVLVRAGPGTGKTVSLQQLTRIVAKRLVASAVPPSSGDAGPQGARRGNASSSSVDPNSDDGHGVALVPMLLSVQRLASYMKQRGGLGVDGADLLRAYIDTEYAGAERDLLAQAYQLRALVVAIDGVDEAASLKARIEDLVVGQLAPMGVRTVVSSRPEGVRLERYNNWVVMNLSPLSDEQQRIAISAQLQESQTFENLQELSKVRRKEAEGKISEQLAKSDGASAHYEAISAHVKSSCPGAPVDETLDLILDMFERASKVPVMLSMYVLCLAALTPTTPLSTSRLELYKSSVRAALRKKFPGDAEGAITTGKMLAKMSVANHLAQRREFTSIDVEHVLADSPEELALWRRLDAEGGTDMEGVPLIKTLEVGEQGRAAGGKEAEARANASKYQFAHLSFQESFFAEALVQGKGAPSDLVSAELAASVHVVWERGSLKLLNDRWLLNTFTICGGALGPTVGEHLGSGLTELRLTEHQVKTFIALEWEVLRGRNNLTRISLVCGKGADMTDDKSPGVVKLAALLAERSELPNLVSLDFGSTAVRIGTSAAAHIAAACSQRKGLRLIAPVHAAQFCSLGSADAVLIAATLRNCAPPQESLEKDVAAATISKTSSGTYCIGSSDPSRSLADTLKAVGVQLSSIPKDMSPLALLAGFSASELRTGMRLSTAELCDAGCTAVDIALSIASGMPTAATLRELADNNLALELLCTAKNGPPEMRALKIDDLRSADCKGVPTEEDVERVLLKSDLDSIENLASKKTFNLEAKNLNDADGTTLLWAIALYGNKELSEIGFTRNELGARFAVVLSEFLRFNTTLEKVDLHDNRIDDAATVSIAKALSINATLATLRLSNNSITKTGAGTLFDGITRNYMLQHITMEASAGTMTPGLAIRPLKGVVPSDQIDLSSRHFGVLSTLLVCKLMRHYKPQLVELAVDKNPLLAEGAAEIADMLKTNDDIRVLDVRFCALGPDGIKVLAEALRVNTSVERVLALSNNVGARCFEPCKEVA